MLNCIHLLGVLDQAGQKGAGTRIILNVISVNHDLFNKFTDLILNKTEVSYQPKQCTIEGKSLKHHISGQFIMNPYNSLWILNLMCFTHFGARIPLLNSATFWGDDYPAEKVAPSDLVGFGDRLKLLLGTGLLIHVLSGQFCGFFVPQNWRDVQKTWKGANHCSKESKLKFLWCMFMCMYIYILPLYVCIYIYCLHFSTDPCKKISSILVNPKSLTTWWHFWEAKLLDDTDAPTYGRLSSSPWGQRRCETLLQQGS